jgi:hypothetical protein
MSEQKRDRKAEWAAKNKEVRAEKAREVRKLARITKMSPAEAKESSLAEVFKAEEDRKALAARAQTVGDAMQAQRWAEKVAADVAAEKADMELRQRDPQAWAVEQLRVMLAAPYEQERVRRLQETAYNMGVPLDQLDTTDSFRIEQMIRAMAYCPDSEEQPFEAGVRWAAGQLVQLAERGYMPNANTAADLIMQLRSEKGLL